MRNLLIACSLLFMTFNIAAQPAAQCVDSGELDTPCADQPGTLSMNDIQAVGSHNSYKLAIPPAELARIAAYNESSAKSLDYSHLSLSTQLDLGMRQIEIDIFYDPEGGRYADPLLPRQTAQTYGAIPYDAREMRAPGFKVLHSQDIDVRSNCATWIACLSEIRQWSLANPDHVPLLIMFNAKDGGSAYPGVEPALDFDTAAYEDLDRETLSVFDADHIIKPDDVRGSYGTLREAVLAGNWPGLNEARGKVFFALDERPSKVEVYLRGNASLEGLPMFVNSVNTQADHAAYFTMNNPVRDQAAIQEAVEAGFIVRTRADANTEEARTNSTGRRDAAFSSGAQYVSTDYYVPRLSFSAYQVELPMARIARCNPVRLARGCD